MENKIIVTPSGKFHAMVAGTGEPLILIHGYSPEFNSWRTWRKNIDALASVARVYALDMLGYGESDKFEPMLGSDAHARAVLELLDAEKIQRATIVGLSWGGGIAERIAAMNPDRVSKLVLVDSRCEAAELAKIRAANIPVLVTWDQDDTVIPVSTAHQIVGLVPEAQLRIFKHAERDADANPQNTHWSQESFSEKWNQVVSEFVR